MDELKLYTCELPVEQLRADANPNYDNDGDGYTPRQGDANDTDRTINPNAVELCGDGIDNDCDWEIDETCVYLSIISQPVSKTVTEGQSTTLSVTAIGNPAPSYQWLKNGIPIRNATEARYFLRSALRTDAGDYSVTVSNTNGSITSDIVSLNVTFSSLIAKVEAGDNHSLFLKADGTLWACGDNRYGQLGDGTTTDRLSPVLVMNDVQSMAAGWGCSFILKTDSTLWACGVNWFGQLGDGTTTDRTRPVQVMTDVQSMGAGKYKSLILKTDGTLWACGTMWNGSIQISDETSYYTPVQVKNGIQSLYVGNSCNFFLRTDGVLLACGFNFEGQLGDGTTVTRMVPVQCFTGGNEITLQPSSQNVNVGQSVTFTVIATGNPAPVYQWKKNGIAITNATGTSYTIPAVIGTDAGDYSVTVSNINGSITSDAAALTAKNTGRW